MGRVLGYQAVLKVCEQVERRTEGRGSFQISFTPTSITLTNECQDPPAY